MIQQEKGGEGMEGEMKQSPHFYLTFPSQNGDTPLFIACQEGHADVVSVLLKNHASVDKAMNVCFPLFLSVLF